MSCAGISSAAKIRNLSSTGALIEAPITPTAGSSIRLLRGSLAVDGKVVWATNGRFGAHFLREVIVSDWIAPAKNAQQDRVDKAVALVRSGAAAVSSQARQTATRTQEPIPFEASELAAELAEVCRFIDAIGATLAADADLLRRFEGPLQNLDIAAQSIGAVAGVLTGRNEMDGNRGERLSALRASRIAAMAKY
jgi:hypothetical protein